MTNPGTGAPPPPPPPPTLPTTSRHLCSHAVHFSCPDRGQGTADGSRTDGPRFGPAATPSRRCIPPPSSPSASTIGLRAFDGASTDRRSRRSFRRINNPHFGRAARNCTSPRRLFFVRHGRAGCHWAWRTCIVKASASAARTTIRHRCSTFHPSTATRRRGPRCGGIEYTNRGHGHSGVTGAHGSSTNISWRGGRGRW